MQDNDVHPEPCSSQPAGAPRRFGASRHLLAILVFVAAFAVMHWSSGVPIRFDELAILLVAIVVAFLVAFWFRAVGGIVALRGRIGLPESPGVGVPRRFGVGKLMLVIALFSAMFGIIEWLGAPSIVYAVVIVFFAGVAAAQAILYQGKRPREASIVAGAVLGPVIGVATHYIVGAPGGRPPSIDFCCVVVGMAILGAPCGYMAGCLMAGLFLIKEPEAQAHDAEEDPLAPEPAAPAGDSGEPTRD